MATEATARATLLTYAIANRQDSCGREGKKSQCPNTLPPKPASVFNTPTPSVQVRALYNHLLSYPIS